MRNEKMRFCYEFCPKSDIVNLILLIFFLLWCYCSLRGCVDIEKKKLKPHFVTNSAQILISFFFFF